jgi:hypothetical protein
MGCDQSDVTKRRKSADIDYAKTPLRPASEPGRRLRAQELATKTIEKIRLTALVARIRTCSPLLSATTSCGLFRE